MSIPAPVIEALHSRLGGAAAPSQAIRRAGFSGREPAAIILPGDHAVSET